jgi:hypothetical protein
MKRHNLSIGIVLLAGMFLSAARPAKADLLWDWSYSCSLFSTLTKCQGGGGLLSTGSLQGSGINAFYTITDITGTVEGNTITALEPPNSLGFKNDNQLDMTGAPNPSDTHKITGIEFLTNNDPPTNANVNLIYEDFIDTVVGFDTQILGPNGLALESIDWSSKQVGMVGPIGLRAAVPEPSSSLLACFALGCLMLGSTFRKSSCFRRKTL